MEKNLLPQIRKFEGSLQEWSRLSAMLSSDVLNYNELQMYVDTLPLFSSAQIDRKELPNRKKEDAGSFHEVYEQPFNPHRTFGGERSKGIMTGLRQFDNEPHHNYSEGKRESIKEISQPKELSQGKEFQSNDSYRKPAPLPLPLPALPQQQHPSSAILHSLDRLLRQLSDNQQRIEVMTDNKLYM